MADGPPVIKKRKIETIFEQFKHFSDKDIFLKSYKKLCTDIATALLASRITFCDANTNDEVGKPFSAASCRIENDLTEGFPFGSIFADGIDMMNNLATSTDCIFEDKVTETLLSSLLEYIFDEKSQNEIIALQQNEYVENETHVMTTLAWHFFGKLSTSKSWIMDKSAPNKRSICKCGSCKVEDVMKCFDDTSIDQKSIFHCNLADIDDKLDDREIAESLSIITHPALLPFTVKYVRVTLGETAIDPFKLKHLKKDLLQHLDDHNLSGLQQFVSTFVRSRPETGSSPMTPGKNSIAALTANTSTFGF